MSPSLPRLLFLVFLAGVARVVVAAQPASSSSSLPPSTPLVESEAFAVKSDPNLISLEREGRGSRDGRPVWRARVAQEAKDPWLAQLKARVDRPVKKGEVALLHVRARAVETSHESDQAQFRLVVADEAKPFPRIASGHYFVDREWREFALPFAFARDFEAGTVTVMVDLGFGRQAVELAGLELLAFGSEVPVASLPRTRPSYRGHAENAPWRREALERIEKIRKGELALELVDARGRAARGAEVRAVLRSHAFQFGVAVNVDTFTLTPEPDRAKYREHIAELFNAGTLENGLKWGNWLGEKKPGDYRARTFETLDWLGERGFAMRGHVMVWPGKRFLPEKINSLLGTPEQDRIPGLVLEHIQDIGLATKDHVMEWDVLNEPVNNHDLMDAFGREIMVDWFKEAAKVRPDVPLFLNDWGNHDQRQSPQHVADFTEVARYLIDAGAPLGGIGLQCHIGGVLSAPEDILATLDRHQRELGLPVRVTEFDVAIDDAEIQADYTRDFFIAMFSHPSVIGVQQWGFWAGRHWEPKAALYTKDWKERPNGAAYRKLVKETWHTDASGRTDRAGRWSARGFYGRYVVTVRHGGREHGFELEHRSGGAPLRLVLPDES